MSRVIRLLPILFFLFSLQGVQAKSISVSASLEAQVTTHGVLLTWTANNPPTMSYGVMRGTASGNETPLITVTGLSYDDSTATTPGQTYWYWVFATDGINVSSASPEAFVTYPQSGTTPTVSLVTVSCSPSTLAVGAKSTCTAVATGTNNPPQTFTWSTNAPGGIFTATTVGTFSVTATSTFDTNRGNATTVTVTAAAPTPTPTPSVLPETFKCSTVTSYTVSIDVTGAVTTSTPTTTSSCVKQ